MQSQAPSSLLSSPPPPPLSFKLGGRSLGRNWRSSLPVSDSPRRNWESADHAPPLLRRRTGNTSGALQPDLGGSRRFPTENDCSCGRLPGFSLSFRDVRSLPFPPPSRTPSPPHLCGFSRAPLPIAPLPFGWGRATWSCLWWAASRVPSVGQSPAWELVEEPSNRWALGGGARAMGLEWARGGGGPAGFGVAGFLGH